nr:transposase [Synechococcus sp. CCY 0621]
MRTSPKALLRLMRQRWAIENQWHWPRDTQVGEDAQRYSQRHGVQVLALLRTLALNLLRCNSFRSIRAGQWQWRMTSTECCVGLAPAQQKQLEVTFSQPCPLCRLLSGLPACEP